MFRAAVETGGAVGGAAVAASLRSLDISTFFGRVRFGSGMQRNVARSPALMQWRCQFVSNTCEAAVNLQKLSSHP